MIYPGSPSSRVAEPELRLGALTSKSQRFSASPCLREEESPRPAGCPFVLLLSPQLDVRWPQSLSRPGSGACVTQWNLTGIGAGQFSILRGRFVHLQDAYHPSLPGARSAPTCHGNPDCFHRFPHDLHIPHLAENLRSAPPSS